MYHKRLLFLLLSTWWFIFQFLTVQAIESKKVAIGYFPNWLGDSYPISRIQFDKLTHIHYAFAIMVKGAVPEWTDPQLVETQLAELVTAAHKRKTKVLISLGGWTGSISFSEMAKSPSKRKEFINWNIEHISKYNTDGVDIDWEYPGRQGAGCNVVDPENDVKNLLTLITELRKALNDKFGKGSKEISIASYTEAFKTESGPSNPHLTASIGKALDRINIMTYDMNGAWNPQTGPNSPLKSANISFISSIDFWISLGVPVNKLVGGLAFYGRSTVAKGDMTKSNSIYQDQIQNNIPKGDSADTLWQDPYCKQSPASFSGIWKFDSLLSQGLLETPIKAKAPWVRTFDKDTATPWLFNPSTKIFISYDDPISIEAKVNAAKRKGIGGVMVWSIDQDSNENDLLNALAKIHS
ncbi:glycoside hydrolase superfamily [Cokeromyces recurvatus]|uniref:glycoside hydrolase superfamily n=1 Tax=Cokeromyces recurvatus TaxID=90255 RepID=UPI00221F5DC8|nr:glycoside hydrolase superfamily [Cokeromyces recurvatus]KAI7904799.1 glycoside hydrolase superfamily [Cokeromyces recurvatus]